MPFPPLQDIKTPARPPAYAFVWFEDERDATDAVCTPSLLPFHAHLPLQQPGSTSRDPSRSLTPKRPPPAEALMIYLLNQDLF